MADFEQQFIESWRKDLLDRAWSSLEALEKNTGQPYHTVLRTKVSHPDLTSDKLAQSTVDDVEKTLHRRSRSPDPSALAREIRQLPAHEVRASLDNPSRDDLEQELIDLNLLHYCRPFMKRRDQKA